MTQPSQFIIDLKSKMTPYNWELLQAMTAHLHQALDTDVRSANDETATLIGTILMAAQVMLPKGTYARWLHGEVNLQLRKATLYRRAAHHAGKSFMSIHEILPPKP